VTVKQPFVICILAACLSVSIGCGPSDGLSRVPVKGKLTLEGKPLERALIRFVPTGGTKGYGGSAVTETDGSFVLQDDRGHSGGVVPGEYIVSVSKLTRPDGSSLPAKPTEEDFQGAKETMPGNITSADNSPLRHTVSEKGGEANVDIPASMMKRNR
jgi:hypothetical protein